VTEIGYALSSELYGPTELVDQAVRAEEAGFDFVSISDHFHPWIDAQGESPLAWTTLGGVARATDEIDVGTGVTCPIQRVHPAIVAQAAATTAAMMDGRFFFGVGSGERLNEHVLGDRWPPHDVRLEMLEEAVEVIRDLWSGEMTSHHGEHYTVEDAQIFTLPDELPPIHVSAYGEQTAEAAARFGDGFYTVGPQGSLLDAFEDAGGEGPAYAQMSVSYEETPERAVEAAYERWPTSGLTGELNTELATPAHFEQACEMVQPEDIAQGSTVTDPGAEAHVEHVRQFVDAGFDHVQIHQVGTDLGGFFETYERDVLPEFQ
jgi:G6PDH family F420-dependent oxidoreductase